MSRGQHSSGPEARDFLEALFADKPDDLYVLLWTLSEKESRWFKDLDEAILFAESRYDRDLYFGVGLSRQDYGPSNRCPSNEVAGIVGVWADLDVKSEAHPNGTLPRTISDAMKILPEQLPPSVILQTGNGAQALWLFREPLIFETQQERRQTATLLSRWQTLLQLNAASEGWTFDRLGDLARVLRVPGTMNCKDPANRKPVRIHSQTDHRYNPSELAEYLDDQGIPDAEEQQQTAQAWKAQFGDKLLRIDLSACAPDEFLNPHMEADPRFRSTWSCQRQDLKDQSPSGYDLALANFGFEAGLSEQQVVDLIIHHRRIHGHRPRTRLDYFQRTISKAFKCQESAAPSFSPPEDSGSCTHEAKPNSATARALLCEQISSSIGVRVLRIVKVTGQEPTYRVELEDVKIGFLSLDKLIGQQSFRLKIASAVEHLVPRMPGKVWDRVAQMMLNALTVEDGGDEAELVGSARTYVERYLSETPFIDADEQQPFHAQFKPAVYEGQIAIRAQDLQQHINKTWNENRPIKEVIAMLSALGASSSRLKRTRLRDQSRWLLPTSQFAPNDYIGSGGKMDNHVASS